MKFLSQESKRLFDIFLSNSPRNFHWCDIERFTKFVQQTFIDNSLFETEYEEIREYMMKNGNLTDKETEMWINLYYKIFYKLYHMSINTFDEEHKEFIKQELGL
jgi:hypothetical protein